MNRSKKPCGTLLAVLLLPLTGAGQDVQIHRCPQADGTVAFQEIPCPEPAHAGDSGARDQSRGIEAAPRNELPGIDDANDESEASPASVESRLQTRPSAERAECEKMTRDAIDAIDEEMRKNRSKEARETYLGELLDLTQRLRACKRL